MSAVSVRDLRAGLQGLCPGLLHELVPGMRREGTVWAAPNPTRANDTRSSFKLWGNGAWREYDEPEDTGKGDILGLVAYVAGFAPRSREGRRYAIDWAKKRLGVDNGNPEAVRRIRVDAQKRQREADKEERARAARTALRMTEIWRQAKPFSGPEFGLVRRYLRGRGIDYDAVPHACPVLKVHPHLRHWGGDNWTGPAMIAAAKNAEGVTTGIHATFLHEAGDAVTKAPIASRKLMLGPIKGSVVQLTYGPSGLSTREAQAHGVSGPVVLCEGIETGLALALSLPEARVWACLSLGNMANAPVWLPCVASIYVALENDTKPTTLKQRDSVLETLEKHGKPLATMSAHQGNDFADLLSAE
jgi:hypothetical protein